MLDLDPRRGIGGDERELDLGTVVEAASKSLPQSLLCTAADQPAGGTASWLPASAHSCITRQIRSRPARTAASSLRTFSLAIITPLIGRPVFSVWASSSAAESKG